MDQLSKQVATALSYQPQVNTSVEDDPDSYMMLVPAARKRPVLQILCAIIATALAIIALWKDEISDGDVRFSKPLLEDDFLDEVDYDCGWNSFRVNYWFYEDEGQLGGVGNQHWREEAFIFEYEGSFCEDHDTMVDADFCVVSETNGKVWLSMSIIGIIGLIVSIPFVWFQGKASNVYPICLAFGTFMLCFGSFYWFFHDKCEDVEKWPQQDITFTTSIGMSLVLMWISIFFGIIGILISSIHLLTPLQKRKQQKAQQAQEPRIQTHVVN